MLCAREKNLRKNGGKEEVERIKSSLSWIAAYGEMKMRVRESENCPKKSYRLRISVGYILLQHMNPIYDVIVEFLVFFYCPLANDTKWPSLTHSTQHTCHINWYACVQFFNGATFHSNISIANPRSDMYVNTQSSFSVRKQNKFFFGPNWTVQ